jgi:hypothetical protein
VSAKSLDIVAEWRVGVRARVRATGPMVGPVQADCDRKVSLAARLGPLPAMSKNFVDTPLAKLGMARPLVNHSSINHPHANILGG